MSGQGSAADNGACRQALAESCDAAMASFGGVNGTGPLGAPEAHADTSKGKGKGKGRRKPKGPNKQEKKPPTPEEIMGKEVREKLVEFFAFDMSAMC